jgi:hypothetical protein
MQGPVCHHFHVRDAREGLWSLPSHRGVSTTRPVCLQQEILRSTPRHLSAPTIHESSIRRLPMFGSHEGEENLACFFVTFSNFYSSGNYRRTDLNRSNPRELYIRHRLGVHGLRYQGPEVSVPVDSDRARRDRNRSRRRNFRCCGSTH